MKIENKKKKYSFTTEHLRNAVLGTWAKNPIYTFSSSFPSLGIVWILPWLCITFKIKQLEMFKFGFKTFYQVNDFI